jgi:DNA-binding transcriptional regulator YiaG
MGKVESIFRAEMVRLARREMRKDLLPLRRDVRSFRATISQLRKSVSELERFATQQKKVSREEGIPLEVPPEEVKKARFSPRLIKSLRKRLSVTQKELAALAGVTVGAVFQWEKGIFEPAEGKKKTLIALRKLGRREARRILNEQKAKKPVKKESNPSKKMKKKATKK